jgi:hypothetical protein
MVEISMPILSVRLIVRVTTPASWACRGV